MNSVALTVVLAIAAAPAWPADAPAPVMDRLVACAALEGGRERLECYDRDIMPIAKARSATARATPAATPVVVPATVVAPVTAVPLPPSKSRSLGEEQLPADGGASLPNEKPLLHARITDLKAAGHGFLVFLDNDQVWHHEDVHLGAYLTRGEPVTISKGVMGSYRLTRDAGESRNWIRVDRVR